MRNAREIQEIATRDTTLPSGNFFLGFISGIKMMSNMNTYQVVEAIWPGDESKAALVKSGDDILYLWGSLDQEDQMKLALFARAYSVRISDEAKAIYTLTSDTLRQQKTSTF